VTQPYGDRPAFIDPAPEVAGGEVGHSPAPAWFRALAVLLVAAAVFVLFQ
jgi:hypothetical protein